MSRTLWLVMLALAVGAHVHAECLPSGRATFAQGLEALSRGDLQTAEARFEELVKAQPNCVEARNNLAVVLFEMGRPEEADAQLRQAVELNPDYQRGRFNLRRVEGSFRGQGTKPEIETVLTGEATVPPSIEPSRAATTAGPVSTPRATAVPPAVSAPSAAAVPANLAALEPLGATACVVDATQKQVCVYRRAENAIVRDACYAVLGTDVATWPQWVVPSDQTAQRLRLVDATLRRRLRIVPANVEMDDSVRIRVPDFDSLSKKVVAWRSGFVVLAPGAPALGAATAAQSAQQVHDALEGWRQAWEAKQIDAYTGFYSASFVPQPEHDVARWRARKRSLFEESGTIMVRVGATSVFVLGEGNSVVTVFEQTYRAGTLESRDVKALRWERQGDRWLISAETLLAGSAQSPRVRRRRGG